MWALGFGRGGVWALGTVGFGLWARWEFAKGFAFGFGGRWGLGLERGVAVWFGLWVRWGLGFWARWGLGFGRGGVDDHLVCTWESAPPGGYRLNWNW